MVSEGCGRVAACKPEQAGRSRVLDIRKQEGVGLWPLLPWQLCRVQSSLVIREAAALGT